MKRPYKNKGDPRRSRTRRSLSVIIVAAAIMGLLLMLGVAQALSAASAGGSRQRGSGHARPFPGHLRWRAGLVPPPGVHPWPRKVPMPKGPGLAERRCETKYCPMPPLLYKNGVGVQVEPTIHLILWGSNWNVGVGNKLQTKLKNLYTGISGTSYLNILTQYFEVISRPTSKLSLTTYVDTKTTAPTSVGDTKIQEEVNAAISANGYSTVFNAQFVVVPAPGATYESKFGGTFPDDVGFCGYHQMSRPPSVNYSFLAYAGDEPFSKINCSGFSPTNNAEDATTITATHELFEAITNPDPINSSMWVTAEGYEIADICNKTGDEIGSKLWVLSEWDNFKGECALSDAAPAYVYAVTEPASGVTESALTLNGSVNPESMSTEYLFEYGLTTKYGSKTAFVSVGNGRSNTKVKATISGLTAGSTYHFRIAAKNSKGTANGLDQATKTL